MRRLVVATALLGALSTSSAASALETVKVLVPDDDNLQYTSFWIADAGGFFREEGMAIELVVPGAPQQAQQFFEDHRADVAVLPPPVYANLIAKKESFVLVANLLMNDPIELVVRPSVLAEHHLSADQPLKQRLEGLRGVKVGIAPHPPARLRVLYQSQGLDADRDTEMVIFHGKDQNAAFHDGKVDALYAHTPYLEQAIVKDGAVVLVNQTAGEVPELAHRQIHALAVRSSLLELRRAFVASLVRAIGHAEDLIHRSPNDAAAILKRRFPDRDPREIDVIMKLYEPGIPATPAVSAEQIPMAVTLFPADKEKPDLSKADLKKFVATDLVPPPRQSAFSLGYIVQGIVFIALTAGLFAMRLRQVRKRRKPAA